MIILPAIDIYNGEAVRLINGDYNKCTVYGKPIDIAERWQASGAEYIHIVDLNGAHNGAVENIKIIENILKTVNCKVQIGGGIRNMSDINRFFDCGAYRVVLGSACVNNIKLVESAIEKYGSERIVCGIDVKNGNAAINGWIDKSDKTAKALCLEMKKLGASIAVCTDISRDGCLSGVNMKQISKLSELTGMRIVASGGVNSLKDIRLLKKSGAYGVIIGKALYENRISLSDAIAIAEE